VSKWPAALDPDLKIFTLDDLRQLVFRNRWRAAAIALLTAVFGSVGLLTQPSFYVVEATFKEENERPAGGSLMQSLIAGFAPASGSLQASALMKSRSVLVPVISALGLQVQNESSGVEWWTGRVRDSIRAERGRPLRRPHSLRIRDVVYLRERSCELVFEFIGTDRFLVRDQKETIQGMVGVPVHWKDLSFTVLEAPSSAVHRVSFLPLQTILKQLRAGLKIAPHKGDPSLYDLQWRDRDRARGVQLLNLVMEEYQSYLRREHERIAAAQLAYLGERRGQIYRALEAAFDEYAAHLCESLEREGPLGMYSELGTVLQPQVALMGRLSEIDLHLARLGAVRETTVDGALDPDFETLGRELAALREQRDALELSLPSPSGAAWAASKQEEARLRLQKETWEALAQSVQRQTALPLPPDLAWAHQIPPSDFLPYLHHQVRLLGIRLDLLRARSFYPEKTLYEFAGVDLPTAQGLRVEYSRKKDESEAQARQLAHLQQEIDKEGFELSSLATVLRDPMSVETMARANKIVLQLKDERYRSTKEEERWRQDLVFEKNILRAHLGQLLRMEEIKIGLLKDKLEELRRITLDCVNQRISTLVAQGEEQRMARMRALELERRAVVDQLASMRKHCAQLPIRWKEEKWLQLKTDLGAKIVQSVAELVESKTIDSHLHQVRSRPLDAAVATDLPSPPKVFLKGFLFGVAALILFWMGAIFWALIRGMPATAGRLRALGLSVGGNWSAQGSHRDLFRQLRLFFQPQSFDQRDLQDPSQNFGEVPSQNTDSPSCFSIQVLATHRAPDISFGYCEYLARSGHRVLLIHADFEREERPGLAQWLDDPVAAWPVQKGNGYDWIGSGGPTEWGPELLSSQAFRSLLTTASARYDQAVLWLRTPLGAAELELYCRPYDRVAVLLAGESTEELTPLFRWAYHGENHLTLICAE
jgi:hypothetical protein